MGALWVFGYGSLIWHPGFPVAETRLARLEGFRRSFCMRSIHHRGTPEAPGLVLALDAAPGAACDGLALAVAPGAEEATLAYLRERELVSAAYLETRQTVQLACGTGIEAVAFVVDRAHGQYCGGLPLEEQAAIIARAEGGRGPNREYLWNTAAHLAALGIADADLAWLAARVRALSGIEPEAPGTTGAASGAAAGAARVAAPAVPVPGGSGGGSPGGSAGGVTTS